ncbi:MAG TPA: proton-conducting transporter membrane subunit [Micromonosporaceae bacterium]|nr:proton-conducting transporter membrane subunit [Micromonosporaceae bacterium]
MTAAALLLPIPVAVPLLGAGIAMLVPRPVVQRFVSVGILSGLIPVAVALGVAADRSGHVVLHVGSWPTRLGIALVADRLSTILLVASSIVLLAVLVYSLAERESGGRSGQRDRRLEPGLMHPVYLALAAGVNLAFLTADLFNLFVAIELMLAASYVLITLAPTPARIQAAMTYTVVSLTSSILFLTTIAVFYAATGTVSLALLPERVAELPVPLQTALGLMIFVVFAIKAAVVPLHMWLPDSYPIALTRITAVFAALMTKVAIYALIRTQTLVFPQQLPSELLLGFALATLLVGIAGAITQDDINRLLSFTLVGHVGYLLFGLALFSSSGLGGTILYLVHHIVLLAALFLIADLISLDTGSLSLRRLGGIAAVAPVTATLFLTAALSASGVPPLSGFLAKLALVQAGVRAGGAMPVLTVVGALATSLLTLLVMSRVWSLAFWGRRRHIQRQARTGARRRVMVAATTALVVTGVAYAVFVGPLAALAGRAADDLLHPESYREALLEEKEGTR